MIEISLPYEPTVSVNHWRYRDGRMKRSAKEWLDALANHMAVQRICNPMTPPLLVGIEIIVPNIGGRLPDTENFRKGIHDAVARGLWVDDQQFIAWQKHSPAARRVRSGEEPQIIVRVSDRRERYDDNRDMRA